MQYDSWDQIPVPSGFGQHPSMVLEFKRFDSEACDILPGSGRGHASIDWRPHFDDELLSPPLGQPHRLVPPGYRRRFGSLQFRQLLIQRQREWVL